MVIAMGLAYLFPIITFAFSCFYIDEIISNLKSELLNLKFPKINIINSTTILSAFSLSLRFYIFWFPDSFNTRFRPLAYPLLDILYNLALFFIVVSIIQIFIYLKEVGLLKMIKNVFTAGCLGVTLAPLCFLILKGVKNIIPDAVLLVIVDVLEFIR